MAKRKKKKNETHGMSRTRQYRIFIFMRRRCYSVTDISYGYCGGRGVTVCDRWLNSFENFWEDMKEGYADHLQIDRIDNDGNYCKENCRWVTQQENIANRRENHGERRRPKKSNKYYKGNLSELLDGTELELNRYTVFSRLKMGWSLERAISTPVRTRNPKTL